MVMGHSDKDDQYTYMDFYMDNGGFTRCPKVKKIKVKPASAEVNSNGCTLREDRNIVAGCKALAMEFVTTDKVLKKLAQEA